MREGKSYATRYKPGFAHLMRFALLKRVQFRTVMFASEKCVELAFYKPLATNTIVATAFSLATLPLAIKLLFQLWTIVSFTLQSQR